MQSNGKNSGHAEARPRRARRWKPIFWALVIAAAATVLYFIRPWEGSLGSSPPPPTHEVQKAALPIPRTAAPQPAGGAAGKTPETVPDGAPKVVLRMDRRRALTPGEDYMAPRWSRDGLDILVTRGKYNGLYLISQDGTDIRRISDEPGIGYNARWSLDGNYIIVEQGDQTRFFDRSGQEVDVDDLPRSEVGTPVYAKDGVVYRQEGAGRSEEDATVMADEDRYFEPLLSPDESKIAYIGLESGIVIKDLQTQQDTFIGLGTDICWLPDGSGIIFNYTQDDGEQIIDGDIYFAYADGSGVKNLTNTPDVIERRPNLSWDGSQLTYEVEGQIFSVDVVID